MFPSKPIETQSEQESVWDYPRPPRLELSSKHIQVVFNGVVIADSMRTQRVLETSHPPAYYIPPEDIKMESLKPTPQGSYCEWKGNAGYYTVMVGDKQAVNAAWYYSEPTPTFTSIKNYVAFYANCMDACYVDGERVIPQPGDFYGGWITSSIIGPFKGSTGTWGW